MTICCDTDDQAINDAIDLLRKNGFGVILPDAVFKWESPAHFSNRVGIAVSSLQRTLRKARSAGIAFDCRYHDTCRMRVIRSNPDLETFIQRNRAIGTKSPSRPLRASV